MMKQIGVKFTNYPELEIELIDNSVSDQYYQLVQQNYQQQFPTFYDSAKYNVEYLYNLVTKFSQVFKSNWMTNDFSIENTTQLHKDIEKLISQGFDNIPAEWDEFINEIHFCLHAIETKQQSNSIRDATMTIEWLNDSNFSMPEDFVFQHDVSYGDIKLQNPYVGHPPSMIYAQQDISNIFQTCRFHDLIKPGIVFCIQKTPSTKSVSNEWTSVYKKWWQSKVPDFVEHHGWDKILRYTGWPVIGKVKNLDVLDQVRISPKLTLDSLTFY